MVTTIPQKAFKVTLEGKGEITLSPKDYVISGGEGAIYKPSSGIIVKLYSDVDKMVHDGMPDKLTLLSGIKHPFIVSPQGLVLMGHKPVGFYMNFEHGDPLARVFTTGWRQRENFTDKDSLTVVDGMRTVIQTAHAHHAVLVDANEMNWLVNRSKGKAEPRVIDVDSWAISHWKASVIMPSIRDWHTNGFTDASDWFSFAVVSFQVFTGTHPYKGTLQGYKMNDIETRMKDNRSVFASGVKLNSAVRDFGCIPKPLLSWYEQVFEKGLRTLPPSPYDMAGKVSHTTQQQVINTTAAGRLLFKIIYTGSSTDTPLEIYPCGVIRLASGKLINLATGIPLAKVVQYPCEIVQTDAGFLVAERLPNSDIVFSLVKRNGTVSILSSYLKGKQFFRYQNRLFVVGDVGLIEVTVKEFGQPILATVNTWQALPTSTQWFSGVGVQNSLGAIHLVLPFGDTSCTYVAVPELRTVKVVNALAGKRYVVVVALDAATGQYRKYEFVFNQDYTSYTLTQSDIVSPDLNMALLPKGVTASIIDDGTLTITVPGNGQVNHVQDKQIQSSFVLGNWGDTVVFIHDHKVWSVGMKP